MNGEVADNFRDRLFSFHQPELSKIDGSIYVLFSDGEIVLTKCGSILWEHPLHSIEFGYEEIGQAYIKIPEELWPNSYNGYGFIFCTREQALMLREEMANV